MIPDDKNGCTPTGTMSVWTYSWWLLAIAVLAWIIRLGVVQKFVGFTSPLDPADGLDEADYELFAYQMSVGNGYVLEDGVPSARRAPGTSLLILPIYLVAGRSLLAARLWFTLLSAFNCAAAAWVVRPKCGPVAALLTAAAMAVNPGMFYYALHLWSEVPYSLAATLALGCMLRAVEVPSRGWSWCAGVAWGAAVLLRPQTVFLAPCVLVGLAWLRPGERKRWFFELLREACVVLAIIAPWLIRNQLVMGSPTMATLVGGHTFWGAHNGMTFRDPDYLGLWRPYDYDPTTVFPLTGSEVEQDRQAWGNGWRFVRSHLPELPRVLLWKVYRLVTPFEATPNRGVYWAFAITWMASVPWVLWGMFGLKRRDPALFWWFMLHVAAALLCTLIFYGAARFRHAIEPLLMMAAAVGVASLFGWRQPDGLAPVAVSLDVQAVRGD